MKISEQWAANTTPSLQKKQDLKSDFDHWIKSPAKQSSGDEYYWQHQSQLEQSRVQFDSLAQVNTAKKQIVISGIKDENIRPSCSSADLMDNPLVLDFSTINDKIPNKATSVNTTPEAISPLNQTMPTNLVLEKATSTIINNENTAQVEEINSFIQEHYHKFLKNHHLFIHNNQVELSINTHALTDHEKKDLTLIMKHYLKSQNLSLHKLIINGVEHD